MKKNKVVFVPTPLEIAILLTLFVLVLSALWTETTWVNNFQYWSEGLWSLLTFMTQMCLILLGGYVVAASLPVNQLLQRVARLPQSNLQSYWLTFFVSALSCWLNWGLGLVVGAFFALEMARQNPKTHFPLLVAASYIGFLFWHGGLSGSIPLTIGTPGNFSEKWLGTLIPFEETVFSFFNLSLIFVLLLALGTLIFYVNRQIKSDKEIISFQSVGMGEEEKVSEENSSIFSKPAYFSLIGLLFAALIFQIYGKSFSFGLNQVNFLLILVGLVLHRSLSAYMMAVQKACRRLAPILVQYPLYAGIMGIMINSGLAVKMSDAFVSMSSAKTYPLYMFLSAGLVNLFVPSGGGQWAVQAPVVIQGAKELSVPLWKVSMAVAWGDAWTNLAQPFWALPLLSIVGLGIRDIMGYCLKALLVSGIVISSFFLFF